jgi:hypothetical protein
MSTFEGTRLEAEMDLVADMSTDLIRNLVPQLPRRFRHRVNGMQAILPGLAAINRARYLKSSLRQFDPLSIAVGDIDPAEVRAAIEEVAINVGSFTLTNISFRITGTNATLGCFTDERYDINDTKGNLFDYTEERWAPDYADRFTTAYALRYGYQQAEAIK